ncbi:MULTISPECIES: glycosyltransferase [Acinetobacter]|uniref:glycosyltransferase n=1 Tax=Acinetobacter TaxID=469 RepID=UPI0014444783|nr:MULTISPECIES: glycosyltransferase [Acinetobacter]UNW09141.1 glycosyltransferase [Acinetobacter indicus]
MDTKDLITIYIPTFNRLSLLKRAIESILAQTYQNFEVIIIDDNSTDGTHNYLKKISLDDSRIRYFLKEENSGACISRNMAIESAKGKYITGLDDDDYFLPNRLEEFINYWSLKNKDTIALTSGYQKPNHISLRNKPMLIKQKDLLFGNFVGNQIFTETKTLQYLKGFDANLKMWQDLDMWYRVLSLGNIQKIPHATYFFDTSHLLGRISEAKGSKIFETTNYFVEKHKLTPFEKRMLNNHLYTYGVLKSKDHFANICKEINKIFRLIR